MGSRFVRPDIATLHISNGDTLTVKRRLNSGEQRAAYARMFLAGVDGTMKVNPLQTGMALITAYLLDWSLTDDAGNVVAIRDASVETVTAALDALDQDSFIEVKDAIEAHEQAVLAEREAAKKKTDGTITSDPTSPSPSDVDGHSMKSEHLM